VKFAILKREKRRRQGNDQRHKLSPMSRSLSLSPIHKIHNGPTAFLSGLSGNQKVIIISRQLGW
jgi:hypothetical protein